MAYARYGNFGSSQPDSDFSCIAQVFDLMKADLQAMVVVMVMD